MEAAAVAGLARAKEAWARRGVRARARAAASMVMAVLSLATVSLSDESNYKDDEAVAC